MAKDGSGTKSATAPGDALGIASELDAAFTIHAVAAGTVSALDRANTGVNAKTAECRGNRTGKQPEPLHNVVARRTVRCGEIDDQRIAVIDGELLVQTCKRAAHEFHVLGS